MRRHSALPYDETAGFANALALQVGVAARALEFTIATAARTGETIGAKWSEIDMAAKLWTVPAERMKAGREHRVPLSPRAVEILNGIGQGEDNNSSLLAARPGSRFQTWRCLKSCAG